MAENRNGTWSLGESCLWISPNSKLNVDWSLGESIVLDEYIAWRTVNDICKVEGHDFDTFFSEVDSAVASFQTSYTVSNISYSSSFVPKRSYPKEYTAIITLEDKV